MEQLSLGSLKKMGKAAMESESGSSSTISGIDDLGDDLLQNVLRRLPATSFASAACVSHSWNSLCNRILSSPKLASAVSFNPSLENAVDEVIDKVLSEPIRPHFALASVGPSFSLQAALQQIDGKLGSRIPIIVNVAEGIIGQDVRTNQFVEVQWELTEEEDHGALLPQENVIPGILLTVGYLPGLKTFVLPFVLQDKVGPQNFHVDEYVMDIKKYSSIESDSESPTGIILFAEQRTEIKSVLQKFEFAFPKETFIVGDGGSEFLYKNDIRSNVTMSQDATCAAVSLIFARDKKKPLGIGETDFRVMISAGISPVGEAYKAVSVKCRKNSTWLTAARETDRLQLDGQTIMDQIYEELGDQYSALYIGVTKRRKCSVGKEAIRRMEFCEFHYVEDANEEYLIVSSTGIQTGDPFRFYVSDPKAAMSSSNDVSNNLGRLKLDCECKKNHASGGCDKEQVFGGMIFCCCGRGTSFFTHPGSDSSPFLDNFPGVPFGGTYCAGEIARGCSSSYDKGNEKRCFAHCNEHVFSAVYLVMSYCPPPPDQ